MEVRPKKALGQHFLTDQSIARAIVDSLGPAPRILEVGPGMGVLTQYLLARTAPAASGCDLRSDEKVLATQAPLASAVPGTLSTDGKNWIQVRCGRDVLRITELQVAGKKRMDVASFLLGFRDLEKYRMG